MLIMKGVSVSVADFRLKNRLLGGSLIQCMWKVLTSLYMLITLFLFKIQHTIFLLTVHASAMSWTKFQHSRTKTFFLRPGGIN
jgi:hypothetical protein